MKKITILLIVITLQHSSWSQGSGNTLTFNGTNETINIGNQVANGCRTIELWFKLNQDYTPTTPNPYSLIVRDFNNGDAVSTNEFQIAFISNSVSGGTGGGYLHFIRKVGSTSYRVKSNSNYWESGHWYHVAAIIHPLSGMRIYINGELQSATNSSTNPIQVQNSSLTDDTYIGKWGYLSYRYFPGEIDEVRLWTTARTQTEIRDNMCRKLTGTEPGLKAYYNFDGASGTTLIDQAGSYNGTMINMNTTNRVYSGAPIGDTSTHLYSSNFTGQSLSLTNTLGDTLTLSNILPAGEGVHIYKVNSLPNTTSGLTATGINSYYGVFMTDTNGPYDVEYAYNAYACDSCASIFSRNDNSVTSWSNIPSVAVTGNCSRIAQNQSTTGQDYRDEYFISIKDASINLGNDTTLCAGDTLILSASSTFNNYKWQDGSNDSSFTVTTSGTYFVLVDTNGCAALDTIVVTFQSPPTINLGNDTTLCDGSSILLDAGTGFVSYLWNGVSINQDTLVTQTGVYFVTAIDTLGCIEQDSIDVNFTLITYDTILDTICLGDSILFGGIYRDSANFYSDTLNSTLGCDSIIVLNLFVNPVSYSQDSIILCLGDSLLINGNWYFSTGVVSDTLLNINGCDSIHITTITSDTVAPNIVCPTSLQDTFAIPCNFTVPNYQNLLNITDNCTNSDSLIITQNPSPGTVITINSNVSTLQPIEVFAEDQMGNIDSCFFNVSLYCDEPIRIPQFISPNGDGMNDTWIIDGLNLYPNNNVSVFNRWGSLVFQAERYQNNWDGENLSDGISPITSNTKKLPSGTYFYILKLGDGYETYTGYLQIRK